MTQQSSVPDDTYWFLQRLRAKIVDLVDDEVWQLSSEGKSLTAKYRPLREEILSALSVNVEAQYWVARTHGTPRVSFEFYGPKSRELFPDLCDQLASDFRAFLCQLGLPLGCEVSRGATVLRVPVKDRRDAGSRTYNVKHAFELFDFIRTSIERWHNDRLRVLLTQLSVDGIVEDLDRFASLYDDLVATESMQIRKSRVGQGLFRDNLLAYWKTCAVTGMAEERVLRASHIKPWCRCSNRERLDTFNGLLLAPQLDALFDCGLISFDDLCQIVISEHLSLFDRQLLSIHDGLMLRNLDDSHRKYLRIHRMIHRLE
jgi:hypothetical protein